MLARDGVEVSGVAELAVPASKDATRSYLSSFVVGHHGLVLRLGV